MSDFNKIKTTTNKFNFKTFSNPNLGNSNNSYVDSIDILELGKGPISKTKYESIVSDVETANISITDLKTIAKEDAYLIDILKDNPNLIYEGTEIVNVYGGYWQYLENPDENGHHRVYNNKAVEHSIEINSYKIRDSKTGCIFYIQRFYGSEETAKLIIGDVQSLYERNPQLISDVEITINNFDNTGDVYFQEYGRPGKMAASGGLSLDGKKRINFFGEWIETRESYAEDYNSPTFIMAHEAGHSFDFSKNQLSDNKKWIEAMELDNNHVSYYSRDSYYNRIGSQKYVEDFAESVAYLDLYGAEYFKKYHPNRAVILEKIFPTYFK